MTDLSGGLGLLKYRYVTLRYVTLRYVTLRYVTLRYVTLRYENCNVLFETVFQKLNSSFPIYMQGKSLWSPYLIIGKMM